jgi:hypothetical protein
VLEADPTDLSAVNRSMPAGLDAVLSKCLRKDREERYASTRDLVTDLENVRRVAMTGSVARAPGKIAGRTGERREATPLWWWQFHQVIVGILKYAMLYPLWQVRSWVGGRTGAALFFGGLVLVSITATLRLHLWFTSRYYPAELAKQRMRSAPWIQWPEAAFAVLLLISAVGVADDHAGNAALLAAVAIGLAVSLWIIEPTTTRAAFRRGRSPKSSRPKRT